MKTLSKLLVIVNNLDDLNRHLNAPVPAERSRGRQRWQYTPGQLGLTNEGEIGFDADEFGLFVDAGEVEFANDASLLARRHSTTVHLMKEYFRLRADLLDRLPAPVSLDGLEAGVELDHSQLGAVMPRANALENMLHSMGANVARDVQLANSVADRFGPICRRYLKDPAFPTLNQPAPIAST